MHGPLRRRLTILLVLRIGLLLLVAVTSLLYLRGDLARHPISERYLVGFVIAGLGLSAFYASWLRWNQRLRTLSWLQLVLDQALSTVLVYITGGPTSGATSLYGLVCVVGAVMLGLRASLITAAVGLAMYALLAVGYVSPGWGPPADQVLSAGQTLTGSFFPILVNLLGVTTVAGLAGYLASRLDVTGGALVRAEERAASAERLALLGRVAAGLAHEIRNPLSSISASIEMLGESTALADDDRQLCGVVQREVSRLNDLVSDMMDLSKPRTPQVRAEDVSATVRDVAALAASLGRSASGDVEVRVRGCERSLYGAFDGAQLRQVLWNLVKNAVEASAAGSSVQVRVDADPAHVQVHITDHGRGMSEQELAQLFDLFYTTRTRGTGIGLAVVRRIVDDHAPFGATLDVHSSEGQGTTFTLRFPRAEPLHSPYG